jgi:outer membrane protein assembly factor BamB
VPIPVLVEAVVDAVERAAAALVAVNPALQCNERVGVLVRDALDLRAWYRDLQADDVRAEEVRAGDPVRCVAVSGGEFSPGEKAAFRLVDLRRVRMRLRWVVRGAFDAAKIRALGDSVFVLGDKGLHAYDLDSGGPRWVRPELQGASECLLRCGSILLLVDPSGTTHLIHPQGGDGWCDTGDVLGLPTGAAWFSDGQRRWVVVGRTGGLSAVTETGDRMWSIPATHGEVVAMTGFGRHAVVGSNRGFLYGIDALRGTIDWRSRLGGKSVTPMVRARQLLVFTQSPGTVCRLNGATGDLSWASDLGNSADTAISQGELLVVCGRTGMGVVEMMSGRVLWELDGPILGVRTTDRGVLVLLSDSLCCREVRSGDLVWSEDCQAQVCMAAASGVVGTLGPEGALLRRASDGALLHRIEGLASSPIWFELGEDLRFMVGEHDDERAHGRVSCYEPAGFLALVP